MGLRADCARLRACGLGFAAALLVGVAPNAQAPDLDTIVERLDDYLERYEPELSAVVADEVFTQSVDAATRTSAGATRRMVSEVAFLRLPGDFEWLGFRSVMRVDGSPVTGSTSLTSLTSLLSRAGADVAVQASALVEASSKYNLGQPRTINMPNLPLEMLLPKHQHRFEIRLDGRERVRGHATAKLVFTEIGTPNIIYYGGLDLPSRVRAWVDPEAGTLWRAEVRLTPRTPVNRPPLLRVEFAEDRALGIMVPVEMREEFLAQGGTGTGRATYSNFRRFQTSARIVPPGR